MSRAQLTQLLITLAGIAIALAVFLWGPFDLWINAVLAGLVFLIAGTAAGFAYARLSNQAERARDLRDRVDNPPA
jgi:hypothetical protein